MQKGLSQGTISGDNRQTTRQKASTENETTPSTTAESFKKQKAMNQKHTPNLGNDQTPNHLHQIFESGDYPKYIHFYRTLITSSFTMDTKSIKFFVFALYKTKQIKQITQVLSTVPREKNKYFWDIEGLIEESTQKSENKVNQYLQRNDFEHWEKPFYTNCLFFLSQTHRNYSDLNKYITKGLRKWINEPSLLCLKKMVLEFTGDHLEYKKVQAKLYTINTFKHLPDLKNEALRIFRSKGVLNALEYLSAKVEKHNLCEVYCLYVKALIFGKFEYVAAQLTKELDKLHKKKYNKNISQSEYPDIREYANEQAQSAKKFEIIPIKDEGETPGSLTSASRWKNDQKVENYLKQMENFFSFYQNKLNEYKHLLYKRETDEILFDKEILEIVNYNDIDWHFTQDTKYLHTLHKEQDEKLLKTTLTNRLFLLSQFFKLEKQESHFLPKLRNLLLSNQSHYREFVIRSSDNRQVKSIHAYTKDSKNQLNHVFHYATSTLSSSQEKLAVVHFERIKMLVLLDIIKEKDFTELLDLVFYPEFLMIQLTYPLRVNNQKKAMDFVNKLDFLCDVSF